MRPEHRRRSCAFVAILLTAVCLAPLRECQADEFCVETDVFVERSDDPVLRTRTLFAAGVVYDFLLSGSREITIFDPRRGRFVLLDEQRKLQTTLTTEDILKFTAAIQAASQEKGTPQFFQRDWSLSEDEKSGWLELSGERIRYRAQGSKPEEETAARRYREFADWYARLNAMRRGNIPPFARIELNKALAERNLIPTEIERILTSGGVTRRKHLARSRHLVHWRLSNTDRKRIQEAAELQAQLPHVPFSEYRDAGGGEPQ